MAGVGVLATVPVAAGREGTQVHAGTERAIAAAREHDGAEIGIVLRLDDRRTDRADELGGQRVARRRTIEPCHEDRPSLLAHERRGVGHPL